MRKKIVALSGIRSEYDILFPVIEAIKSDDAFDVSIIACGAHLSESFGYTVKDIEKDGVRIDARINNLLDSDSEIGKAKGAGLLAVGLSDVLDRLRPDYLMVVGDREESVIAGVICTYLGIPFVHLCGGDRTDPKAGDVDEPIRHAASKMAALHFTMNEQHRERLIRMGEEPWRVHNVGDPGLDRFAKVEKMEKHEVLGYFGFNAIPEKPLILVLQHVISGEAEKAHEQIEVTLEAVTKLKANCVINYPNSDMGSRAIINVIESYREYPNVKITKNIPRKEFVNLLRNVDLVVGNSSMSILEGCFLRFPAINVGERNQDRMNGGNVVFVEENFAKIKETAERILSDKVYSGELKACRPVYGDGNASKRIVEILKGIPKTRTELLAKRMTY
ncbi:MAG TPA: UDP-N-acetylglucosamine 2-epimerase [Candidatus Omnitrophota bacterium]|nr:UDP-N-acetylglucosamine 2-epimerase [Candidatus Omnitrophota bacterium]HPS19523.1 UDP-N-acetylglucosamine 2-epimerase [Candidatus Omnitrophota bacterium]